MDWLMPFLLDWILNGDTTGHVQSLILGAVLAVIAVQMFGLIIGDALAGQRVIAQRVFEWSVAWSSPRGRAVAPGGPPESPPNLPRALRVGRVRDPR